MPMNRADYPARWNKFSRTIRVDRARGRCECIGQCGRHQGRCDRVHAALYCDGREVAGLEAEVSLVDGEKVARCVLTVAHLNARGGLCQCEPLCAIPEHVLAMCQGCHLTYDRERHMSHASETRDRLRGQTKIDFP